MPTALIILAAGKGTRMNSDLPKVLQPLGGFPLFAHAMQAAGALGVDRTILVVGHGGGAVESAALALDPDTVVATQKEQLGTAHAVLQAREALAGFQGDVVVLYGDTPFVTPETLGQMATARKSHDLVVLGFEAEDPEHYGRLIMTGKRLEKIVECKDATVTEKQITLCNSGIQMMSSDVIFELIDAIDNNNAKGEFYLTDTVEIAGQRGLSATAVICSEAETLGVDSKAQLASAEAAFQAKMRSNAVENGVIMVAPDTAYFALDTHLGRDVTVEPNVVFGPGVTVETGATIRAFSHLEGCHVGARAVVGPYARLRPGAELANGVRVGNFVEIKNAEIGEDAKIGHLSYIGDADIGSGTNIGAGTITCNYDGVNKHRTVIGENAFIGSDTMLVAPVTVGRDAFTATGTVVTDDVPDGALAIGRARQIVKPGLARKLAEKLRSTKTKLTKDQ